MEIKSIFCIFLVALALSEVKGRPSIASNPSAQALPVDDEFVDVGSEQIRVKRFDENLQDYRDQLLQLLNEYRVSINLPEFRVDPDLERGAQAWALEQASEFTMTSSCTRCAEYSEVLGKRRSSRPIPEGADAADWTYYALFGGDEERTFAKITDDPDNHSAGFGIAFVQDPSDGTYHSYPVVRFAHDVHH